MDELELFALQLPETTDDVAASLGQALLFVEQSMSVAQRQKLITDLEWISVMTPAYREKRLSQVGWSLLPDNPDDEDAFFADLSVLVAMIDE